MHMHKCKLLCSSNEYVYKMALFLLLLYHIMAIYFCMSIYMQLSAAVVCPEEFDIANGIQWPSVTANTSVNINCTEGRK